MKFMFINKSKYTQVINKYTTRLSNKLIDPMTSLLGDFEDVFKQ